MILKSEKMKVLSWKIFFEEPIKWYDHVEDMIKLSKVFPETFFILDEWGEELGENFTWMKKECGLT